MPSWIRALFIACLAWALGAPSAIAAGRLVDVAWLQQHRADVLLLDASSTPQHRSGHIPGAINADRYRYGADEPTRAAMEQRMQDWGIHRGQRIVVYDAGGDWMAARLFHDLYVHGVPAEQLLLLDGGLARWKAQGGAVTTEATPATPRGNWQVTTMRLEERVELPEFLAASGLRGRYVLADALTPSHYYGQQKFFDRAGHVPGAVLMPSEDFFNADKTFRGADDVRRMMRYRGIGAEHEVLSHCGGGGAAAVPWFALRFIAEHPKTRLFLGSQREWLRDDRGLPFWSYAEPQLLRDSAWLAGWNQPMLRMFGVARLNIVDVRTADAYAQGHVPFALHLPAAALRAQLRQPQALAATLGSAGVQPQHEVVLVSDNGLTPDAALAFLAFEQLGHPKVSLLLDTVDEWGLRGFETTRQPTRVGAPRAMGDTAVPAATYPSPAARALRPVLLADAAAGRGENPRVFVAVGRDTPAPIGSAPLVHLPASELLAPNGAPKPAPELWKLIEKAGVPRQAEVVLVASDVAEAAVGYFIFRMMGWPDLKVWAR